MATKAKQEASKELQTAPKKHALSHLQDMDRLFENFLSHGWMKPFNFEWPSFDEMYKPFEGKMPHVDVVERDDEILVKAELPGVEKKDLDISVTKNSVTICGTTQHEEKEEKGEFCRREISKGSYSRTLTLPADIDENKSKAKYKDGVLELTLPKLEETRRHTVEIE
ncbi:MAG: Hsp20/alpha crystallin family protein [Gammaproteobacteria bacterium]|nr:Hsp20/alpha crystallin family protein [Gammaproteobacteria bacterium]